MVMSRHVDVPSLLSRGKAIAVLSLAVMGAAATLGATQASERVYAYTFVDERPAGHVHHNTVGPERSTTSDHRTRLERLKAESVERFGVYGDIKVHGPSALRCMFVYRNGAGLVAAGTRPDNAQMDAEIRSRQTTERNWKLEASGCP
ncbi:hypothetical protein [Brevundimonas sp.]|uniref:hypothetical protein n=1 Tax=Brevundimonas sp. TaxID=1871086 RepID=UPI002FC63C49